MIIGIFVLLGFSYYFINFRGYGFFRSLYLAFCFTYIINAIFERNLPAMLYGILAVAVSYMAFAVYNHSRANNIRFGMFFSLATFIFPLLALPVYLILWKKLKITKTIETDQGNITFYERN